MVDYVMLFPGWKNIPLGWNSDASEFANSTVAEQFVLQTVWWVVPGRVLNTAAPLPSTVGRYPPGMLPTFR